MKAAVVGAGFAGLALSWYLLEKGIAVDLYDQRGIGSGASGVASGLLHPYVGEDVKRSWRASEALKEACHLLSIAQVFSSKKVADFSGLIRKTTDEQSRIMLEHSRIHKDVELLYENVFLIKSGISVYSVIYLNGLFSACVSKSLKFKEQKITSFEELQGYDLSFLAMGAGIFSWPISKDLKLRPVKGQSLICSFPSSPTLPTQGVLGKGHVVPLNEGLFHLGSTYERGLLDEISDVDKTLLDLDPKARALIPDLGEILVKECRAGVRVSHPGHYFPALVKVHEKTWALTALGSRGLLYHGYGAKILVEAAVTAVDPNLVLFKNKPFSYDRL